MPQKKGFTLIEIVVVLIIIGILAVIAVPNYTTMLEQGMAQSAANNLMIIANAEKVYYFANGTYCSSLNGCSTLNGINTALNLNITDSNYKYNGSRLGPYADGSYSFMLTANRSAGPGVWAAYMNYYQIPNTNWPNPVCIQGLYCPSGTTLIQCPGGYFAKSCP